jgi:predicted nucleic acid-binding protein
MRLYLDANAIIYGVEGVEALRTSVLEWIDRVEAEHDGMLLTSELSLLECLVKPTRDGDERTVQEFQAFFNRERLLLLEVTRPVLARAVEIRARHRFTTPDAIHLATAVLHGADAFLTSDRPLVRFDEIPVHRLQA